MLRTPVGVIPLTFLCLLLSLDGANGFYRKEGVKRKDYELGEPVEVRVNRLTSRDTISRLDPYYLALCRPEEGFWEGYHKHQNLGQFLIGSRIEGSPYELYFGDDEYCKQLCVSYLGYPDVPHNERWKKIEAEKIQKPIRDNFHQHFIVDNLSAASISEDDFLITTRYYDDGVPLGYVDPRNDKVYVYNHFNFVIAYTKAPRSDGYNILRVSVEPFSIQYDFEVVGEMDDDVYRREEQAKGSSAKIFSPITSCANNRTTDYHTSYDMLKFSSHEPQLAQGRVLFTYDVIWQLDSSYEWSDRWELYLTMDHAFPDNFHTKVLLWGVFNLCFVILIFGTTVIRKLRLDLAALSTTVASNHYSTLPASEAMPSTPSTTTTPQLVNRWTLLGNDVFRPPAQCPFLLAIFCGTGAQCLVASLLVLFFASFHVLSASNRGALPHTILLMYVLCGFVGGYVAGRMSQTFGVYDDPMKVAKWTALLYPGINWCFFVTTNFFIPFRIHFLIILYWLAIGAPLVWLGVTFSKSHGPIVFSIQPNLEETPTVISSSNTKVQRCMLLIAFVASGLIPFSIAFVEMTLVFVSIYNFTYYDNFRYLGVTWLFVLLVAALLSISGVFYRLCQGNYKWWWLSFWLSGSFVFILLFYCFPAYDWKVEFGSEYHFYGYMILVSFGLLQTMGFVGVASCAVFLHSLYAHIGPTYPTQHSLSLEEEGSSGGYEGVQLRAVAGQQSVMVDVHPPATTEKEAPVEEEQEKIAFAKPPSQPSIAAEQKQPAQPNV